MLRDSLLEQVEEMGPGRNRLTQVHLEKTAVKWKYW